MIALILYLLSLKSWCLSPKLLSYYDTWKKIGENTPFYLSGQTYYQVLWSNPSGGNDYCILAHQFIAAKLNILNGADTTAEVDTALTRAENFFKTFTPTANLSKALKTQLTAYATILDN